MVQIFVNSLVWGAELGLVALGLSLCYKVLRFANFAQVEYVMVGAVAVYWLTTGAAVPLAIAALVALLFTGLSAMFVHRITFSHVRGGSEFSLMLASVGVGMAIRGLVQMLSGGSVRTLSASGFLKTSYHFLGARISSLQILVILVTAATMVLLHFLLSYTKIGIAFRATANNPRLAEARGIDVESITFLMWFMAGCLAALSGILIGLETQVSPRMGWQLLLPSFAAATLGGLGNMYGAVAGGVAVALIENLILAVNIGPVLGEEMILIPTGYKPAISFLLIIIALLFRPKGLLGGEE